MWIIKKRINELVVMTGWAIVLVLGHGPIIGKIVAKNNNKYSNRMGWMMPIPMWISIGI
jgi:hypothetical protein